MSTTETETGAQEAAKLENEAQEATQGAQEGDPESKALSLEDARRLRSEAKNLRERLKAAEAKVAEHERDSLSEKERLAKDLADRDEKLTVAHRELRALRAQTVATDLGFIDPELAEPLIDWEQIDDPDDPRQVRNALKKVVERKPHLVRDRAGADGGAGRGQRPSKGDMNQLIRNSAGRSG